MLAAFVASASWQLLLVGGGALLGRLATTLASSAVIVGLAVGVVTP